MTKNNKERKEHFALSLLVSAFVFIIIAIAICLAILIIYLLLKFGVITSIDGEVQFSNVVILMLIISVVIGLLIIMPTSTILLNPFNRLITQLNRLGNGDFKARIKFGKPIASHPTFKGIEKSFNRAAKELEHTELLRSDFTNNFSHEFKTPIVSIAGFAKLLKHGNLTEEQKAEYLSIIEEESLRLSYMATNVLNLTKIENQTILTDITKFNLSEQIRSCVLLLEDKWTQKNLDIDIDFEEHMIFANEELLKQIWINLLDNAIKFSNTNGKVTIKIAKKHSDIFVSVSNYGNDIPPECQSRIFNKFYQADESHSLEGNGIGLAICKKVCALHNGEINVKSQNGLTTFTIKMPEQ